MLIRYIAAFIIAMVAKGALYRAVDFDYNVNKDGFDMKKIMIDFITFFVIYLLSFLLVSFII
ncbi:MAG: hypothetical protein ACOCQ1_04370 [Halanaerobiaceae bacterium]